MSFSAPQAPDPGRTADFQTGYNTNAAIAQQGLNMISQATPMGNLNYGQIGAGPNGVPIYGAQTSLSPAEQALLQQQQGTQYGAGQVSRALLPDILRSSGAGNITTGNILGAGATGADLLGNAAALFGRANIGGNLINQAGAAAGVGGNLIDQVANTGQIGNALGGQGAGAAQTGAGLLGQAANFYSQPANLDPSQMTNTTLAMESQYLDPWFKQQREDLGATLANQGIAPGSEAYKQATAGLDEAQAGTIAKTFTTAEPLAYQQAVGAYALPLATTGALGQSLFGAGTGLESGLYGTGTGVESSLFGTGTGLESSLFGAQNALGQNLFGAETGALPSFLQAGQGQLPFLSAYSAAQMPQFQQTPTVNLQPANYQGLAEQNYEQQMKQYQAQMSGLFGMPTALLGGLGQGFGKYLGGAGLGGLFGGGRSGGGRSGGGRGRGRHGCSNIGGTMMKEDN